VHNARSACKQRNEETEMRGGEGVTCNRRLWVDEMAVER